MEKEQIKYPNIEEYHNMIWSVIHRKVRSYGIKPESIAEVNEELFSESGVIYLNTQKSYKEEEAAVFSTWLYTQLDYRLGNHIKRKLFHLTPSGAGTFKSIHDVDENLLVIQAENYTDIISVEKEEIINAVYERAFKKWKPKKCAFLFFVYAFDETGYYNKHINDFIAKEFIFLKDIGVKIDINKFGSYNDNIIEDVRRSVSNYFDSNKNSKKLTLNNVRKTIDYYLEKRKKLHG